MENTEEKINFISYDCPQCSGKLELDPNMKTAVCKYCGTQFVIEKEERKKGKLELVLDFFDRRAEKRREDKREKERKKEEKERQEREESNKRLGFCLFALAVLLVFSFIMAILENQGII